MNTCLSKVFVLISFCFLYVQVSAQVFTLHLNFEPEKPSFLKKTKLPEKYQDSISIIHKVNEVVAIARANGYLLTHIKSLIWKDNLAQVLVNVGKQYQLADLSNGNIALDILQKSGYSQRLYSNATFNFKQQEKLINDLLTVYENSGYPFATVYLDSIHIKKNSISAKLFANPGQLISMDSLQLVGDVKISKTFLESFLNLKKGSHYSHESIKNIESRLQELPYLQVVKKSQLIYTADKASITLYLKKQNASQFDGILGLLPDNTTGKLQLTGDLKLHIQNAFKQSELLDLSFKGLPGKSRELNLAAGLPELFSTPLGLQLNFNLFKQDTNFQNIYSRLGLNYRIPKGYFTVFITSRSGAPVLSETKNNVLPSFASVNVISYGSGWVYNSLNSRLFPSQGLHIQLEAEAGKRKIAAAGIPPELKDSLALKSAQYRIVNDTELYWSLSKRGVFKLSNQTGLLIGNHAFQNEMYRIGGFNSLRGFDEQSILATNYTFFNAEYRQLIESRSFLFVFINQAFFSRAVTPINYKDAPMGFGTGINLETKAGIFSLSYALGKQKDNPLNLQRGKIHFGLVTLF